MPELPSGTVTFLFTDIEGSTRLLEALGEDYGEALTAHRAALRVAFAAHGGVEVDNQGDAFFFAFPDAREAVRAAAAGRDALASGPVRVRMGLHTGTPSRSDEGYFGRDVNLGARVAASAHGGQVVFTKATRDLLDDLGLRDLGEHRVKDIDEAVWIYQLGEELFPPLKTISNTNLPHPASSFVGREREVGELVERVRDSRLVTLTGPGGSGKTRLAIEAAGELVGDFKNGVFWVPLATVHDPEAVLPAIAQTIGAQGDLATYLGERETLLLLDNLEQVVNCAPDLATLVEACPNVQLLVTSRELLRVRGESECEVLPLADPDAVELFTLRSGLAATARVEELCRRLDNMPLALELAAARTKALTPEHILERLGQRLDLFQGGRDAEARQKTLRATIEWSHELLTPEEQGLFARLGVFVGGCTLEAAETVAGADLDGLQSLVEKSLLRHTEARFWMLETIREYAVEHLVALPDAETIQRRYAEFLRDVAEASGMSMEATDVGRPSQPELVLPEMANVRAALDWCVEHDPGLGLRMMSELEQFWVMQSPFEGARRFDELLQNASNVPPLVRARALRCLGGSRFMSNDVNGSIPINEEALAIYRHAGDEAGVATMVFRVGTSYSAAGELEHARRLLEESLAMCRRLGLKVREVEAAGNLARIELQIGDPAVGRRLMEENLEPAREVGFMWWVGGMLIGLAEHSLDAGDLDDAERKATEALELEWELMDRAASMFATGLLAGVAAGRGDRNRAGILWGAIEAEEQRGPVGHGWEAERVAYVAHLEAAAGEDFERARAKGALLGFEEAVQLALSGRNHPNPSSR